MELLIAQQKRLSALGQEHLLSFVNELPEREKEQFLKQVTGSDIETVLRLYKELVKGGAKVDVMPPISELSAAPYVKYPKTEDEWFLWLEAKRAGVTALKSGQVACLMVAGGQGSRLGFEGPKGAFPIGPVSNRTLFQVQSEKVLAASKRYNRAIPFFIMVSESNEADTRGFFIEHDYFGLDPDDLYFFKQENIPAVDENGKIVLEDKGRLFTSPNGHGGCVKALRDSGMLEEMKKRNVHTISYFQVDNPLVRAVDPYFIGFHIMNKADMSLKCLLKRSPSEKVGNVVMHKGRLRVIEYSDLSDAAANLRDEDGGLRFRLGSIAIHIFDAGFLRRMSEEAGGLPYHVAHKKIACIDLKGNKVEPKVPNGYKFEMFIFDTLPQAQRSVVVETIRENEFSPVKNAEGEASPATSRADLARLYGSWLAEAGLKVPSGDIKVEISPLVATDGQELKEALAGKKIQVRDGLELTLDKLGEE